MLFPWYQKLALHRICKKKKSQLSWKEFFKNEDRIQLILDLSLRDYFISLGVFSSEMAIITIRHSS
jgi:hypothetical protein